MGGDDFASVMSQSMQPPPLGEGGRDLPDGFPLPQQPHHRVVDSVKEPEGVDGAVAYDFTVRRAVFLIYRSWEECSRCANALATHQAELPEEGDYVCPHVNLGAYKEVVDRALDGKIIIAPEQEHVQKDGSIIISLRWYEPKLDPKKAKRVARHQRSVAQRDEPDL